MDGEGRKEQETIGPLATKYITNDGDLDLGEDSDDDDEIA